MEKEFNVRELNQKELKETNGGLLLLTLLFIGSLIIAIDNIVDALEDLQPWVVSYY